jgi:hypothetical protein
MARLFLAWQLTNRCTALSRLLRGIGPDKVWRDGLTRDGRSTSRGAWRVRHRLTAFGGGERSAFCGTSSTR